MSDSDDYLGDGPSPKRVRKIARARDCFRHGVMVPRDSWCDYCYTAIGDVYCGPRFEGCFIVPDCLHAERACVWGRSSNEKPDYQRLRREEILKERQRNRMLGAGRPKPRRLPGIIVIADDSEDERRETNRQLLRQCSTHSRIPGSIHAGNQQDVPRLEGSIRNSTSTHYFLESRSDETGREIQVIDLTGEDLIVETETRLHGRKLVDRAENRCPSMAHDCCSLLWARDRH